MTAADDKVAKLDSRIFEADQKIANLKGELADMNNQDPSPSKQHELNAAQKEREQLQQQRDDVARARVQADRDAARNDAAAARGQEAIDGVSDLVRPDPPPPAAPPPDSPAASEPTDKDVADAEKASEDARRAAEDARARAKSDPWNTDTMMASQAVTAADEQEEKVKANKALTGCVAPVVIAAVLALGLGYAAYNQLVASSTKCPTQSGMRADHVVLIACTDVAAGSSSTSSEPTNSESTSASASSESTSASSASASDAPPPVAAPPSQDAATDAQPAVPPPESSVAEAPPPESSVDVAPPPPDDGGGAPAPGPVVPPGCSPPDSISVQGGDTGTLPGRGGTFTVTGSSVVLSTPALTDCGQHYRLAFVSNGSSAGGATHSSNGHDCERTGFTYDISGYVQVGDTVSVRLDLPPNDCG
jgi:hypothetical protein